MRNGLFADLELSAGYVLDETINLTKDKKQATIVSILGLSLVLVMVVIGCVIAPLPFFQSMNLFKLAVALVGYVAYIVLHEAVHGVFMWLFSRKKPHFGLSWQYAYAGSYAYFAKAAYLIIGLAPLAVWGMVLLLLAYAVPAEWFWAIWLIQVMNVGGSGGDLFVVAKIIRKPANIRVQDDGTKMKVYVPGDPA
ncbi:MAG: DUF3267 domain-containing protein [Clostridiales bacterium]|nr:DUF3267 domain-containing protein [Clostridiales bacterium]